MALIVDRWSADGTADDAVQVVDLDDIITGSLADRQPPTDGGRRRRVTPGRVIGLSLAFALGLALSVPIVAAVRHLQDDSDGSEIDIRDGHRPLPADLAPPIRDGEPPLDSPAPRPDPSTAADPDPEKAAIEAYKEAAAAAPATGPTASSTALPAAPAAASPTAPATTAPSTTAPPTIAPPTTGDTTPVLPDPEGPDYSVPGPG